mmetsp:Transcript_19871/g.24572  ORF Transcript_19871/g.24572 Transcript_19871/m.24572 type:complete len:212 (+) Transcript_19871:171-806(+)
MMFFITLMGRLNGHLLRIVQWVHFLDFEIFGNIIKPMRWIVYLSAIGYSYLLLPFVTLILWVFYLFKDAKKLDDNVGLGMGHKNPVAMAAFSVFLIGIAAVTFTMTFQKIRWNNYRFKVSHMVMLLTSLLFFVSWQFMITFASTYESFSFQGISAVFLTQSGIIGTIIIYLNLYENKFNLSYFLTKFMKRGERADAPNPERTENLLDEIEA